jgi:hypothetical protein
MITRNFSIIDLDFTFIDRGSFQRSETAFSSGDELAVARSLPATHRGLVS